MYFKKSAPRSSGFIPLAFMFRRVPSGSRISIPADPGMNVLLSDICFQIAPQFKYDRYVPKIKRYEKKLRQSEAFEAQRLYSMLFPNSYAASSAALLSAASLGPPRPPQKSVPASSAFSKQSTQP